MGYTTFTGPVRAGNILDTSGVTPGVDVSNVGQVVMAQAAAILEGATPAGSTIPGLTTISIPAGSEILSIELRTTVNFTSAVSIGGVGTSTGGIADATYFTDALGSAATTGLTTFSTTTTTQNDNWISVGTVVVNPGPPPVVKTYDVQIVVAGGFTNGPGRGVLTVTYLQGPNGNA